MKHESDRIRLAAGRASQLAGLIASRSAEPEGIVRAGIEGACAALGSDAVFLVLSDPAGSTLTVLDSTEPASRNFRLPSAGLAGAITQWNRGEVVPDIAMDPRRDELAGNSGMRRFVCSPVRIKGAARGALLAGSRAPGSSPSDASDLLMLGLFADLIAISLGEIDERRATQSFHAQLSQLAARSFDRFLGDELDPALNAVARERGLVLDGAECDPVLPEIARIVRASAAVLAAPGPDKIWRVADSWNLPAALTHGWTESDAEVRRIHQEGRFSCASGARGFEPLAQDLRVQFRAPDGARVLHLLAHSSRGPFGPADVRCAEMAAVRIGWTLHALAMEAEEERAELAEISADALEPVDAAA